MNLSLVRIQRFVAVAEHLSFTRAAAILGIDQPWLSRQVMQLEDQLGIVLLHRTGSRISLTREGKEFYEVAREVELAAQRVREKAEDMTRRNTKKLNICVAYATFAIDGRNRLLSRFAELRPEVEQVLSAAEWTSDVLESIKSGRADFGIAFGPIDDPEIETCQLEKLKLNIAVPQENPLSRNIEIAPQDLRGQKMAIAIKNSTDINTTYRYGWIEEYGAIPVHVPEGRRYIMDVARKERMCVVCYTLADIVPNDFNSIPVTKDFPAFNVVLFRSKRIMSSSAERLWRLAFEISGQPLPET
jgi:DNA-binding transcriptional LysR family regulator